MNIEMIQDLRDNLEDELKLKNLVKKNWYQISESYKGIISKKHERVQYL